MKENLIALTCHVDDNNWKCRSLEGTAFGSSTALDQYKWAYAPFTLTNVTICLWIVESEPECRRANVVMVLLQLEIWTT